MFEMFKKLILFVVLMLAGCGSSDSNGGFFPDRNQFDQEIVMVTPGPTEEANRPVYLSQGNFETEMSQIIQKVALLYPQSVLPNCELGVATPDGFQVTRVGDESSCAILFLSQEVAQTSAYLNGLGYSALTVAVTTDVVGSEYPLIFVMEGAFDFFYLVRVMAHEGLHASRIREGTNVLSNNQEEEIAYNLQFEILEKQYSPLELAGAPQTLLIPGLPESAFQAIEFEHLLFQKWKEGSLLEFLELMEYNPDVQES